MRAHWIAMTEETYDDICRLLTDYEEGVDNMQPEIYELLVAMANGYTHGEAVD